MHKSKSIMSIIDIRYKIITFFKFVFLGDNADHYYNTTCTTSSICGDTPGKTIYFRRRYLFISGIDILYFGVDTQSFRCGIFVFPV